jgi:HD-like signal output (HDOD) protein
VTIQDPKDRRLIGQLLIQAELITSKQLEGALDVQAKEGGKVVETLIRLGHLDTDSFVQFLARQPGVASIDLASYHVDRELINLIPREFATKHEVFPIDKLGRLLTVGMVCPLDTTAINELSEITGLRIKPVLCPAKSIRGAIARYYPQDAAQPAPTLSVDDAEGLRSSMSLQNVAHLIRQLQSLPALPETVQRVREVMANPLSSLHEVAEIITLDPPIAAKVLSVANSAAYGFQQRVDDLNLAVSLLGLRETYSIVLSAAVIDIFAASKMFDYESYWKEAMCSAAAARLISQAGPESTRTGAFTAGLLHDLGRVALAEVAPKRYERVGRGLEGRDLIAVEEEHLGLAHTEAGYELASHWELPTAIAEPIRFHHDPGSAADHGDMVAVVALADVIIRAPESGEDAMLFASYQPLLARLGLTEESAKGIVRDYLGRRDDVLKLSLQ